MIFNLFYFYDVLHLYILNLDENMSINPNHFYKKLIYFLQLRKDSKTQNQNELKMLSFIFLHMKSCKKTDCVCQKKKCIWDAKKQKMSDMQEQIWKNIPFLKELVLDMLNFYILKHKNIQILEFFRIQVSVSVVQNIILATFQNKQFILKQKSFFDFSYFIFSKQIEKEISILINKKPEEYKFSRNRFEKLLEFDILQGILKLSIVETIKTKALFWEMLNEDSLNLRKLQYISNKIMTLSKTNKVKSTGR